MKRITILIFILFCLSSFNNDLIQAQKIYDALLKFNVLYNTGDFINAEKCLTDILKYDSIPVSYKSYIYNGLGATSTIRGKYADALKFFDMAEKSYSANINPSEYLAAIYINKALIFGYQESYNNAVEYFEKGIRTLTNSKGQVAVLRKVESASYLDFGIVLYELGKYADALKYLGKSNEIDSKYNLPEKPFVDLNIAKVYVRLSRFDEAQRYFDESCRLLIKMYGPDYYRLAELYFEFGPFLYTYGKYDESLRIQKKAESICLRFYGEKHSLTSLSHKLTGDFYLKQHDYLTALKYYQSSLISISQNFNSQDIYVNPDIGSSLFDVRLLDDLKAKSLALELLASQQSGLNEQIKTTSASLETIVSAIMLIERMRNNFLDAESRLYLSENEKDTYLSGTRLAASLYSLTGDSLMADKMYALAQKAKACTLRNEITGNNLLYSALVPDSLREKQTTLAADIGGYENLVLKETRQEKPDSNKISLWKDAIFEMNREYEKVTGEINSDFPQYNELVVKTEAAPLKEIQERIEENVTVIDYFLCRQDENRKRKLYIFLVSRENIDFYQASLDTVFMRNAEIIHKTNYDASGQFARLKEYTGALSYMYDVLIKPVEAQFTGRKIVILPDEEISWLPFDAFLTSKPDPEHADYENLPYLIYKYAISYAYSSSLLFGRNTTVGDPVLAFLPDYSGAAGYGTPFEKLPGAGQEIGSIYRWFRGESFTGDRATKKNFLTALAGQAIFHLAMHSVSDTGNSKYSYLQFDTRSDPADDGRLYNYEISLARINSPMVVISACNSGGGNLYHAEGLMSMARAFLLAGTSSVIKTSWEVNDETSASIMTRFYYYLSKGKYKNEALRLAKLDYLKTSNPAYANPYYWAAYEVLGDNAPVAENRNFLIIPIILVIILAGAGLVFYLRRRRIFPARSL